MSLENGFGSIAFITSIVGLFPQVYKSIKTRSTTDVSMVMLVNFLMCSLAWIGYGILSHALFVQLSNIVGLISCLLLIGLKYRFDTAHASIPTPSKATPATSAAQPETT